MDQSDVACRNALVEDRNRLAEANREADANHEQDPEINWLWQVQAEQPQQQQQQQQQLQQHDHEDMHESLLHEIDDIFD